MPDILHVFARATRPIRKVAKATIFILLDPKDIENIALAYHWLIEQPLLGRHTEAEEILTKIVSWKAPGNRIATQIETNLLLGAAIAGQQRWPDTLELIKSSLAPAESEGYIQVFLGVGESVHELLAAYLRSSTSSHFPRQNQSGDRPTTHHSSRDGPGISAFFPDPTNTANKPWNMPFGRCGSPSRALNWG